MEVFNAVSKYCDIRLLKTMCNFRGCPKKPGKEMLIFQIDMDTRTKKDIMYVYLCTEHFAEIEKKLEEEGIINKFKAGKRHCIRGSDIGFVTF